MRIFNIILLATLHVGCFDPDNDNKGKSLDTSSMATGDKKAIALAQQVIDASGGIANWNKVPYLSFNYFDRRYWFWDKLNNRYRVESESRNLRAAGMLDGSAIHLWLNGQIVTDADSIAKYKDFALKAWINDTYWLIFPFKLLDPGVKLRYIGDCMADSVMKATCIELTFNKVGVTPDNKYIAYIDTTRDEVIKWDHFENKNDTIPSLNNPWTDYKQYGAIKLSSGRGNGSLSEIAVHEKLPKAIFNDVSKSYKEILK